MITSKEKNKHTLQAAQALFVTNSSATTPPSFQQLTSVDSKRTVHPSYSRTENEEIMIPLPKPQSFQALTSVDSKSPVHPSFSRTENEEITMTVVFTKVKFVVNSRCCIFQILSLLFLLPPHKTVSYSYSN